MEQDLSSRGTWHFRAPLIASVSWSALRYAVGGGGPTGASTGRHHWGLHWETPLGSPLGPPLGDTTGASTGGLHWGLHWETPLGSPLGPPLGDTAVMVTVKAAAAGTGCSCPAGSVIVFTSSAGYSADHCETHSINDAMCLFSLRRCSSENDGRPAFPARNAV